MWGEGHLWHSNHNSVAVSCHSPNDCICGTVVPPRLPRPLHFPQLLHTSHRFLKVFHGICYSVNVYQKMVYLIFKSWLCNFDEFRPFKMLMILKLVNGHWNIYTKLKYFWKKKFTKNFFRGKQKIWIHTLPFIRSVFTNINWNKNLYCNEYQKQTESIHGLLWNITNRTIWVAVDFNKLK